MRKVIFTLVLVLVPALTVLGANELVINEIMYNSTGTDVEFIELYNTSGSEINVQNWYIIDNNNTHTPCMLSGTISSGGYLVVTNNIALFHAKYPDVISINQNEYGTGTDAWSLGNGGDVVHLFDNSQTLHDSVEYSDSGDWPGSADGNGKSLELLHPLLDNSIPTSWDPSNVDDGTPGKINSTYTENVPPFCKDGNRSTDLPTSSDAITVTVLAFDNEGLEKVELFVNAGSGYSTMLMYDDGTNGDVTAGDSLYSAIIPSQSSGTLVKYYAVATDQIGQVDSWPNDAPAEYHAYTVDYNPPKLRINEVLAVNDATNTDEFGEHDDWIEIYNAGSESVNLAGMYISNSFGSSKSFILPSVNIAPDGYIIIWADNDITQGALHADFKLSSGGEEVALFETIHHGNVLIHGWKYGLMSSDVSMGYKPQNGNAPEYLVSPTPGASNESSGLFSPVCINEFQSTSNFGGPQDDWVEIYNRGTQSFDLSGSFLSDQRRNNTKWTFPQNTVLGPGEFLVIYEDVLGFGFSSDGDDVIMLTSADSTTGLDFYDFKTQQPDISEGRFPDGSNKWQFFANPTKGSSNFQGTEINDSQSTILTEYKLYQNYPNPFNPETTIRYQIPTSQRVTLKIYNLMGQEVITLWNAKQAPGYYSVTWDGRNRQAKQVSSGVYYFRMIAGSFTRTMKVMLLR